MRSSNAADSHRRGIEYAFRIFDRNNHDNRRAKEGADPTLCPAIYSHFILEILGFEPVPGLVLTRAGDQVPRRRERWEAARYRCRTSPPRPGQARWYGAPTSWRPEQPRLATLPRDAGSTYRRIRPTW